MNKQLISKFTTQFTLLGKYQLPLKPTLLPYCEECIPAGFPSPAEGYIEKRLDLNDLVVKHPNATFFVRVVGESMIDAGINSGDILVVDRAAEPRDGKVVVAVWNGEFTVKKLKIVDQKVYLIAENPAFPKLAVGENEDIQVWGVVTHVIHQT